MLPKAILFDMDDTIISFDGVVQEAWEEVCCSFSEKIGVCDSKTLLDTINEVRHWYWGDPERHRIGRLNLDEARREVVRLALKQLESFDEETAVDIADTYTQLQESKIHIFPKAEATLEKLKNSGVKLALITNGNSKKQRAKIVRFNLARFFEVCLVEEEVGFGKPDPRVYKLALEMLGVKPEDTWMVGDNLEWDVSAPQSLGIYGIWNDYRKIGLPKGSKVVPDRIVHSIAELWV